MLNIYKYKYFFLFLFFNNLNLGTQEIPWIYWNAMTQKRDVSTLYGCVF